VREIETDESVYGRWTLVGKRADVLAVTRGTIVEHIPSALRVSVERALGGFCRPQADPDYARGGWEIEFSTAAARKAAARVRACDAISGATVTLSTVIACLGQTLRARAFLPNDPLPPAGSSLPADRLGRAAGQLQTGRQVVVGDAGVPDFIGARYVMSKLGLSRSEAYRLVRRAAGRTVGKGTARGRAGRGKSKTLRITVEQFEAQVKKEGLGR